MGSAKNCARNESARAVILVYHSKAVRKPIRARGGRAPARAEILVYPLKMHARGLRPDAKRFLLYPTLTMRRMGRKLVETAREECFRARAGVLFYHSPTLRKPLRAGNAPLSAHGFLFLPHLNSARAG